MSKKLVLRPVDSTNLAAVGWRDDTLTVQFKSGQTYEFYAVPRAVYMGLLHAESKGRFFHKTIKGQFEFTRINPEES